MSKIKDTILNILIGLFVGLVLWLISKIYEGQLNVQLPKLLETLSSLTIGGILFVILLLPLGLIAYIHILRLKIKKLEGGSHKKSKKIPQFIIKNGIYYDNEGHAFCGTCRSLMTHQLPYAYDENYWWCNSCKKYFAINPSDEDKEMLVPFSLNSRDKDNYL